MKKLGITISRDINQIANFAFIEWDDGTKISDQAPANYTPNLKGRFSKTDLDAMYRFHALPVGWETMKYQDFLEKRREGIAKIIADAYSQLTTEPK